MNRGKGDESPSEWIRNEGVCGGAEKKNRKRTGWRRGTTKRPRFNEHRTTRARPAEVSAGRTRRVQGVGLVRQLAQLLAQSLPTPFSRSAAVFFLPIPSFLSQPSSLVARSSSFSFRHGYASASSCTCAGTTHRRCYKLGGACTNVATDDPKSCNRLIQKLQPLVYKASTGP